MPIYDVDLQRDGRVFSATAVRSAYVPDLGFVRVTGARGATLDRRWHEGVTVTTSGAEHAEHPPAGNSVSIDELARRKGVRPVEFVEDMAQDGVFESDDELEEFLAHVYAARRADLA